MRTRVKICGLMRPEDVQLATRLGADALGFVFAAGKRQLTVKEAQDLTRLAPPWVNRVGVIGPEQKGQAIMLAEACRLDTLQVHGGADAAFCAYHRGRFTMVQALSVGEGTLDALQNQIDELVPHVDGILLDTAKAGQLGGTGETFDWSVLKDLACPVPLMVAGGLNPDNVRGLLAAADVWGVDVSSGVESAPGCKDARLLTAFFAAVERR